MPYMAIDTISSNTQLNISPNPIELNNTTSIDKILLHTIFERNGNGNFTKNALLYQDILLYYSKVIEKNTDDKRSFTLRNLQRWLMKNNHEFIEKYSGSKSHTSISNRISNRQRRINNIFSNLIRLNLIGTREKSQALKTGQPIDTYEFTNHGKLIALLIRSNNLNEDKNKNQSLELNSINQKIFKLLESICNYKKNDELSYYFSYYKQYFEVAYKNNLINKIITYLIKLCQAKKDIFKVEQLLSILMVADILVYDIEDRKDFFKIWDETMRSLDDEIKKIILFKQKNYIEREFLLNAEYRNKEIEKAQFENRNRYDKIVLQGFCNSCKKLNIKDYFIQEYKKILIENNEGIIFDCKKCNIENSGIIPFFQQTFL